MQITQPDGTSENKEKIFSIAVTPGWKNSTKLTFQKEADEAPNVTPGKHLVQRCFFN